MALQFYQPSPISIPESLPVRRELRRDRDDYDHQPLSPAERARYDARTIFYDVWIADDPHRLVAVGPPAMNLAKELLPAKVICNGTSIEGKRVEFRKFCNYSWHLPTVKPARDAHEVTFEFKGFAQDLTVRRPPNIGGAVDLSLVTLQKDNPVHWVVDWCRWHQRLHNVERVFLYDNASANAEELTVALREIGNEMDVVIAQWPFPYGPTTSHANRFGQGGALNHFRECFGASAEWTLFLDVDECLAMADDLVLLDRLREYETMGASTVLFGSWIVPPTPGQPPLEGRSIRSYSYRERRFVRRALKYAFRPPRVRANKNHTAFPRNWLLDRLVGVPALYDRLANLFYWSLARRGFGELAPLTGKVRMERNDEVYFYHFRGLNTNWRYRDQYSDQVQEFTPDEHVVDERLPLLLQRAELSP